MDINSVLFNGISRYRANYDSFPEYGHDPLKDFLDDPYFDSRKDKAIHIVEEIMIKHGKGTLYQTLAELGKIEPAQVGKNGPVSRDHVVHALLSFVLGIYLNELFLKPKNFRVDEFEWELSSLFHDIGYPLELAFRIGKPFEDQINRIRKEISTDADKVSILPIDLSDLVNLTRHENGLDTIQKRINGWGLRVNVTKEYEKMMQSGHVYHGTISSLALLNLIDLMYSIKNPDKEYRKIPDDNRDDIDWNQEYFDKNIVSACSAIFLHDLPSKCLNKTKLDYKKTTLAYLLRLSDSLQEWERPKVDLPRGIPADKFGIRIEDEQIIFSVDSTDTKKRIEEELECCVQKPEIRLVDA